MRAGPHRDRRSRWYWLVGLLVPFLVTAAAAAQPVTKSSNVVVLNERGHVLEPNPLLKPGHPVTVLATGFAPNGLVRVRSGTDAAIADQTASSAGQVRLTFSVSSKVQSGQYVLSLTGATLPPQAPRGSLGGRGLGVTVPPIALVPYRVKADSHREATDAPQLGGARSVLGFTGSHALSLAAAGALLVGTGTVATLVIRRRRRC
jgi:hypothetical protein